MGYCPPHVQAARARGDHDAVVAYARAGGRVTAKKRAREAARKRAAAEATQMRLDEEMLERAVEANEHIVPIDPDEAFNG